MYFQTKGYSTDGGVANFKVSLLVVLRGSERQNGSISENAHSLQCNAQSSIIYKHLIQ